MNRLLDDHELILMEASIVERLRRTGDVALDPRLVHAPLIYDVAGRDALARLYESYLRIADEAGLPMLLCTPTWRASRDRVAASGIDPDVNAAAVRFMNDVRAAAGVDTALVKIGGLIGVKNDCYRPAEGLPVEEARRFHLWQIERLAKEGIDFLIAETIPSIAEGLGIALGMAETAIPYIIGFVIDRRGALLDGTSLVDAVATIDDAVERAPIGYMVNCSYPTFICADRQPKVLFERLIGCQANASSLDHSELDGSVRLEAEAVDDWGDAMLDLHRRHGMKIFGGCCGTGPEHLLYLACGVNRGDRV
jgi:homocysteine S-methyltransferase